MSPLPDFDDPLTYYQLAEHGANYADECYRKEPKHLGEAIKSMRDAIRNLKQYMEKGGASPQLDFELAMYQADLMFYDAWAYLQENRYVLGRKVLTKGLRFLNNINYAISFGSVLDRQKKRFQDALNITCKWAGDTEVSQRELLINARDVAAEMGIEEKARSLTARLDSYPLGLSKEDAQRLIRGL
jgi:hypothetical protein